MGGLLYKDFVSVDRVYKLHLTWIVIIYMMVFIVLRIMFPGTKELQEFIVVNDDGSVINLLDVFFVLTYGAFIFASITFVTIGNIMSNDEKKNIKDYFESMPVSKNTYVASKYVFLGIVAYVFMSIDYILGTTCAAFCREGLIQDIAVMMNSFVLNVVLIMIFLAAIEIPLYLSNGKEIAMRIMVVFWTVIALVVIGFLMFGDLTVVSGWNAISFMEYVENHKSGVLIFQAAEPAIILGLYLVSYLISCRLYQKKERQLYG